MKVSKKRLIEILSEEIARVMKESTRRPLPGDRPRTVGGFGPRDPHGDPYRQRAAEPPSATGTEGDSYIVGIQDGFADKKSEEDSFQTNRSRWRDNPQQDSQYVDGWFAGSGGRAPLDYYMKGKYSRAEDVRKALAGEIVIEVPMQEGHPDVPGGAYDEYDASGDDPMGEAIGAGVDDAKLARNPWGGEDELEIQANEKIYGFSRGEAVGPAGKAYWKARDEATAKMAHGVSRRKIMGTWTGGDHY